MPSTASSGDSLGKSTSQASDDGRFAPGAASAGVASVPFSNWSSETPVLDAMNRAAEAIAWLRDVQQGVVHDVQEALDEAKQHLCIATAILQDHSRTYTEASGHVHEDIYCPEKAGGFDELKRLVAEFEVEVGAQQDKAIAKLTHGIAVLFEGPLASQLEKDRREHERIMDSLPF